MHPRDILVAALIAANVAVNAQVQNPVFSDFKKVPVPPSPNAAALGKFGDIPVSPSTGIPGIQIPIYSYSDKQKDLGMEVSLSYHAGGHKVEDMASNVGLGWALRAGGAISRTMKGLPDDNYGGYLDTVAPWSTLPLLNTTDFDPFLTEAGTGTPISKGVCADNFSDFIMIKEIAEGKRDSEADIFNISVGEINEKFFFNKNGTPIFVTPNNLVLTVVRSGLSIDKFIITDPKGVTYHFATVESTQSDNAIEPSTPSPPVYTSTWYLTKVVSADEKDEILLTYELTIALSYENALTLAFKTEHVSDLVVASTATASHNLTTTYNARRISQISFPDKTTLNFYYDHNREDYTGDKALTSIKISNGPFEKYFQLAYNYFVSNPCTNDCTPVGSPNNWQKRLKLMSVHEESGSVVVPPYTFEYNPTPLPTRNSKDQDWWGFSNGGATGAVLLVPSYGSTPISRFLGFDRVPSLVHCKAWTMEKINYPTGGYTRFAFELNEGVLDGVVKPIGGLRVQKREDFDPVTSMTNTTRYTYSKADGTSSGLMVTIPSYTAYWNTMQDWGGQAQGLKHHYFNESLNPTQTLSYFNGSPVVYTRVKEERYAGGAGNGYSIYEFQAGEVSLMHDNIYPFVQKQDHTWNRGLPIRTDVYNNIGVLLSREVNEYQTTETMPLPSEGLTRNLVVGNFFWDDMGTPGRSLYGARYYYLARGKTQLIKTTREEYANGQTLEDVTEYTYDNTYFLPTLIKTTNSKDEEIEVRNYYPFSYDLDVGANGEQLILAAMLNSLKANNRIADPISVETWIKKGGDFSVRSIVVNEYNFVNETLLKKNKVFLLESEKPVPADLIGAFDPYTWRQSALIKENLSIEHFDERARGVQFKYVGNERRSVIWGDGNQYPVASVENAKYSEIAYTSFEDTYKGNWTFSGSGLGAPDNSAPTGSHRYSLFGDITRSGLGSGTFIVSYWISGGTVTVNGAAGVAGETINEWTYYEHSVTNPASGTITLSGEDVQLDELRLYPANAEMTTYTFKLPVGMTSSCDSNNNILRYEYDSLGRLSLVKDRKNNILKSMKYHYASP